MQPSPQNFVLLRDQQRWPLASLAGLEIDTDGTLVLARIPGVMGGRAVDLPGPYDPVLAAFAVSSCGEEILASARDREIRLVDTRCANSRWLLSIDGDCDVDPSSSTLSACAVSRRRLYVADREAAAVHVLSLPQLERVARWRSSFVAPLRIAVDEASRVYLLDVGLTRILRLTRSGRVDPSYETGPLASLANALDLAVTGDGTAYVSVDGQGRILRLSPEGDLSSEIEPPDLAPGLRPGALAVEAEHLYVADRVTGALWVYACSLGRWLAPVPAFRAPIVALAVDGDGHLCVRTTADICLDTLRLDARAGRTSRGVLEAGPFDAGAAVEWMRVHVDAQMPAGTRVRLEAALEPMPATGVMPSAPAPASWRSMASLDALVHRPGPSDRSSDSNARVLFIRVQVESDAAGRSPVLREITAETEGDDYVSRLPAVYARADAAQGFLRSWLEVFRAELGDRELDIADLSRRLDPAMAPQDHLPWLASWIAYDLPLRSEAERDAWRPLLLEAHRLYERRGTVAGLREMVRLHTGLDCEITETFRTRQLWVLGAGSGLGLDTGLLPALPDGMAVPGPTLADPALQGLSVAYFFDPDMITRAYDLTLDRDPDGAFQSLGDALASLTVAASSAGPRVTLPIEAFAGVWTGQIQPRFSELYSFHLAHVGGVRLFIDDQLLIDTWTSEGAREPRGHLPLVADRWYPIRIEYWARRGRQKLRLSWSSASQPRSVVPGECLYAVSNDNVDPFAHQHDGRPDHLVIGDTVVGAHGPLAAADFGAALFDDAAHHFTVRVRAQDLRKGTLARVRAVLDAEKPAHADYHLCVIEPQFRVGVQARIGVDAVVSGIAPAGRYDEGVLGFDTRLGLGAGHDDGTLRVEENLTLGSGARLR